MARILLTPSVQKFSHHNALKHDRKGRRIRMVPGFIMWLLGVPLVVIVALFLFGVL